MAPQRAQHKDSARSRRGMRPCTIGSFYDYPPVAGYGGLSMWHHPVGNNSCKS